MNTNSSIRYQLDAHDCIASLDAAWNAFAAQNGGPELADDSIIGQSIWRFIDGWEVRHLYEHVFDAVRSQDRDVVIPFRCDSPTLRRFMELRISALRDDGLALVSHLIREEARPRVELPHRDIGDTEDLVRLCSWCKRVQLVDRTWVEVEQAIQDLELFQSTTMPAITHGMCGDCATEIQSQIEDSPK